MAGPIALHGGGEFLPGDEPFLDALLDVTAAAARAAGRAEPLRVVVVPAAAARGRPDLAAANGVMAFERRAATRGLAIETVVARVVDRASADDEATAAAIASADLVYLPGGDPDLIPALFRESAAGRAMRTASDRGAVVGGASAGAMALAEWAWTPGGGVPGLGYVAGIAIFPHYDEEQRVEWVASLERIVPSGLGYLGLDERTGVISGDGDGWLVAGEGAAHWFAPGATEPVVVDSGSTLHLG